MLSTLGNAHGVGEGYSVERRVQQVQDDQWCITCAKDFIVSVTFHYMKIILFNSFPFT